MNRSAAYRFTKSPSFPLKGQNPQDAPGILPNRSIELRHLRDLN
ncbi:hypothetical protein C2W63_00025 [Bacillus velezensis]|nr:hypothetical protein C2W63_00025 [Bacillus velezensis]